MTGSVTALELVDAGRHFAGVHAVRGVSVAVGRGAVVGLVGPNGSGKTTVVNLASGVVPPTSGRVLVDGRDLTGRPSSSFAAAGVIRTFQALRLCETLSALENVLVGAQREVRPSLAAAWLRTGAFRRRERALRDSALAALDAVGMRAHASQPVGALSHGQRRRIELARAFAAEPRYLVLDEPGAGVDPERLDALAGLIRNRADAGAGVLLVEHDPGLVERVADRVLGMSGGVVVAEGTYAQVVGALS